MAEKKLQPIIIKRVKKGGHAVHGGAWKIAYADFVTAMMAFFLLMWLLGSTAKGELQGIAAYFASPLKVAMTGGDGAGNSSSVIPGGGNDLSKVHGQVRRSDVEEAKQRRMSIDAARAERAKQDQERIKALEAKIDALITENPRLNEYKSQIRIDITPLQIVECQRCLLQLFLEEALRGFQCIEQRLRFRIGIALRGLARHFHAGTLGQFFDRIEEFHAVVIHQEADRGAVRAAAEAVIELLGRRDGERG